MLGHYWYRHREREFKPLFSEEEFLIYCNNIPEVMLKVGVREWDSRARLQHRIQKEWPRRQIVGSTNIKIFC